LQSLSESGGILFVTLIRRCFDLGAELKFMQELLRHSTIRVTLDTYTQQAVTTEKRNAQEAVVALLFREKTQET
jgi:integrase